MGPEPKTVKGFARLASCHPIDHDRDTQKQRGHELCDPSRIERAEDCLKSNRDADTGKASSHPRGIGALICQDCSIFGPFGASFALACISITVHVHSVTRDSLDEKRSYF